MQTNTLEYNRNQAQRCIVGMLPAANRAPEYCAQCPEVPGCGMCPLARDARTASYAPYTGRSFGTSYVTVTPRDTRRIMLAKLVRQARRKAAKAAKAAAAVAADGADAH